MLAELASCQSSWCKVEVRVSLKVFLLSYMHINVHLKCLMLCSCGFFIFVVVGGVSLPDFFLVDLPGVAYAGSVCALFILGAGGQTRRD